MDFSECLKKRIVKEVKMDTELVASLVKTSNNKLESEQKLGLDEITVASKISLLYDSVRELLEGLAILRGYKIYNHECYTYFLKEIVKETDIGNEFDTLTKLRNEVNYYGKNISVKEGIDILHRLQALRKKIFPLLY